MNFSDQYITDDRLFQFATSNFEALEDNNTNGQYTQMATDTEAALLAFQDAIAEEDLEFAERQAQTKRLEESARKFVLAARRRSSYINGLDNTNPALYEAFFPRGLAELSKLNRKTEPRVILRIANMAQKYANVIGPAMAAEFSQLFQDYTAARKAQVAQKVKVARLKDNTAEKRKVLEDQLARNILSLGLEYYGDKGKAKVFFQPELISRRRGPAAQNLSTGKLLPEMSGEIQIPDLDFELDPELYLRNRGSTTLVFYLADEAGMVDEDKGVMLLSGEEILLRSSRLGPEGNSFLNVKNLSDNTTGKYEVEWV